MKTRNVDAILKVTDTTQDRHKQDISDTTPLPSGMEEVRPSPEIVGRKSAKAVRYNDLWEAVQAAHRRGKILAVDVTLFWKDMTPRGIYMSLRRTRERHGWPLEFNHSRVKTEGKVYLWVDPGLKGQLPKKHRAVGGPGRPRKAD